MNPEKSFPENKVEGDGRYAAEPLLADKSADSPILVEDESLLPALAASDVAVTVESEPGSVLERPPSKEEQRKADRDAYWNQRIDINYKKTGSAFVPSAETSAAIDRKVRIGVAVLSLFVVVVLSIILFPSWQKSGFQVIPQSSDGLDRIAAEWKTFVDLMGSYISSSGLHNANMLGDVLWFLPMMVVGCVGTTAAVAYLYRISKSRAIDWTDSHLLIEYDGVYALGLKWSSIETVTQFSQWELFHGNQPAFLVTTHLGKKIRLRLSDISQKHNIGEFFSLIKTNAPSATVVVDPNFARDNCFTELWLKYFSTPAEREKTGLLIPDMSLDCGRYKIIGTVGGGGQGTAYLAEEQPEVKHKIMTEAGKCSEGVEHIVAAIEPVSSPSALTHNPQVVLKEYVLPLHRGQLTAERTAEKLKSEAAILGALKHPQIVRLLDAFIEDYRGYLVLEYVRGESLKAMVDQLGPQPEAMVVEWAIQTCQILNYLHTLTPPVVHRDITPDNLMLEENGSIKLVDFNVACLVDSTSTSTVVGKHAYIPAEQFRGKPSAQSDLYSLGGTMYYLLTGQEPEPITQSHPRSFNESVSVELDVIVAKATENSLSRRYLSASEMCQELEMIRKSSLLLDPLS